MKKTSDEVGTVLGESEPIPRFKASGIASSAPQLVNGLVITDATASRNCADMSGFALAELEGFLPPSGGLGAVPAGSQFRRSSLS